MPTQQDILEDILYQQGVSADTSRLVAEAFQALIEFNQHKETLKTKGFIVRENEAGTYDLCDIQDDYRLHGRWHYNKSANEIKPADYHRYEQKWFGTLTYHNANHPLLPVSKAVLGAKTKLTSPDCLIVDDPITNKNSGPDHHKKLKTFNINHPVLIEAINEIVDESQIPVTIISPVPPNPATTTTTDQDEQNLQSYEQPLLFPLLF